MIFVSARAHELRFEAYADSEAQLEVAEKHGLREKLAISPSKNWQPYSIKLNRAAERVNPRIVSFKTLTIGSELKIRSLFAD
jgi:hypothetical protein